MQCTSTCSGENQAGLFFFPYSLSLPFSFPSSSCLTPPPPTYTAPNINTFSLEINLTSLSQIYMQRADLQKPKQAIKTAVAFKKDSPPPSSGH